MIIDSLILFSCVWGIAAAVDDDNRKKISDLMFKLIKATPDIH